MQKYFNNITNRTGDVVPGASVYVTVTSSGAQAALYSDNGVTVAPNPLTCDNNGYFQFYAADNRYTLTISGSGLTATTITDVLLEDQADGSAALAASGGAALVGNTPSGTIAATTVQAAINEIVSDLAASSGTSLVGFLQSGAGAVARTGQDKMRDTVNAEDFSGVDIGAKVNAALAAGHKLIHVRGAHPLSTQILLTALAGVTLDLREAILTAGTLLNTTLVRLINCTRCTVLPGTIDGNAAGQTMSSFGIDLNGGSYNKVIGGRVTNCKTYGVYNIGCNYALIEGVEADNCLQSGIAGDVGSSSVVGFRIRNVVVHDNGLSGVGTLSGLYLEGQPGSGFWFSELDIDGVISYGNRGSGVSAQGWRYYSLSNIKASENYKQGITLAACLYGTGANFILNGNDIGAVSGYDNGIAVDDAAVVPASQYNRFSNIFSANHSGFAVMERGTANNNSFLFVDSVSDGSVFSLSGATSLGQRRNVWKGSQSFEGQFTGSSASSGIGYSAGAGGSVTQLTNKDTSVTLNTPTGRVTMNNAALGAGALAQFTLTNSAISSTDVLMFNVVSGATQAAYAVNARPANGEAVIEVRNRTAGSLSEAIVIAYCVVKGSIT